MTAAVDLGIPTSLEKLDADWLTEVLRAGGALAPEESVAALRHEVFGTGRGLTGQLFRLTARHCGDNADAPTDFVLKLPPAAPDLRSLGAAFELSHREACCYQHLLPKLGVRTPRRYWVRIDSSTREAALLIEFLDGAVTASQVTGADVGLAARALAAAATFHATAWQQPEFLAHDWLTELDGPTWMQLAPIYATAVPGFLARFGDRLPTGAPELAERLAPVFADVLRAVARLRPQTLCHGDFRLDNLLFDDTLEAPGRLVVLDWQLAHRGPAIGDVSNFLTQSLPVETRRAHESELIARWHAELVAARPEVAGEYPLAAAIQDYRLFALYGTMVPVVGGAAFADVDPAGHELFATLAERAFTAALDLDSGRLLPGG